MKAECSHHRLSRLNRPIASQLCSPTRPLVASGVLELALGAMHPHPLAGLSPIPQRNPAQSSGLIKRTASHLLPPVDPAKNTAADAGASKIVRSGMRPCSLQQRGLKFSTPSRTSFRTMPLQFGVPVRVRLRMHCYPAGGCWLMLYNTVTLCLSSSCRLYPTPGSSL